MSMDDIEAVFNKEFKQSSNLDNSHSSSSSLNLCADLLEVFNDMFDQSSSLRPSSTDRTLSQDPDDPNEAEGDGSVGNYEGLVVEHENSEGFEVEHEGGEEQESELEVNIIDISDGEEIVDKLIQVDSRDGYLTLKDNVTNADHVIPRSRGEKAKRVLSLR